MQKQVCDTLLGVLHSLKSHSERRWHIYLCAGVDLRVSPLNSALICYYIYFYEKEQQQNLSSAARGKQWPWLSYSTAQGPQKQMSNFAFPCRGPTPLGESAPLLSDPDKLPLWVMCP